VLQKKKKEKRKRKKKKRDAFSPARGACVFLFLAGAGKKQKRT
jgi:hypothetical protein